MEVVDLTLLEVWTGMGWGEKVEGRAEVEGGVRPYPFGGCRLNPLRGVGGNGGGSDGAGRGMGRGIWADTQ